LEIAFPDQMTATSIKDTAKMFGDNISKVQHVTERRKSLTENKWTSRVGQFFTKLFPIAQFSLNLTVAIADVAPVRE
jgi:hypothetical protein